MSDDLARDFEAAYPELLRMARARLRHEQAPISTRTLTHELYLGLQHRGDLRFASRGEFLCYAGKAMRHLLVDLARERLADKRQAELVPLTLGAEVADESATPEQVLHLNEVLEQLGRIDARLLQVAEMRAVLGLEVPEVAAALGVSEPTVKRDWQRARAFLYDALGRAG